MKIVILIFRENLKRTKQQRSSDVYAFFVFHIGVCHLCSLVGKMKKCLSDKYNSTKLSLNIFAFVTIFFVIWDKVLRLAFNISIMFGFELSFAILILTKTSAFYFFKWLFSAFNIWKQSSSFIYNIIWFYTI